MLAFLTDVDSVGNAVVNTAGTVAGTTTGTLGAFWRDDFRWLWLLLGLLLLTSLLTLFYLHLHHRQHVDAYQTNRYQDNCDVRHVHYYDNPDYYGDDRPDRFDYNDTHRYVQGRGPAPTQYSGDYVTRR